MTLITSTSADALFDRLPVAVFRSTPEGCMIAANPALRALLGYSEEELARIDLADLYVDPAQRESMVARVTADEQVDAEEIELIRRDGSRIWVRALSRAVFEQGELLYFEGTLEDVSDRRRTEDALRESELLFRLAFEQAPQGLAIHDRDGVPVRVNRALCDLAGMSAAEIVGSEALGFVHPDEREEAFDRLQRLRSGVIDSYETDRRIRSANGSYRHVSITGSAIRSADGEFCGFITQLIDLEPRRDAALQLEESEARFRSAFEHAPVGMAITAADGTRLRANPALCRILGVTTEEFASSSFSENLLPEDALDAAQRLDAMRRGELDAYSVERRLLTSSGELRWAQFSVSPVRDEAGNLVSVLTQVEDRTEQRDALEALQRRESEKRALIAAIPDMMFTMDRDGRFLTFEPASSFGPAVPPEDFLGKTLADVFPERAPAVMPVIGTALDTGRQQHIEYPLTLDGEERLFEAIINPLGDHEILMVIRDITDRVRAKTQLEELLRSKDELIASVSHELRTPLTTVVGLATELRVRFDEFTAEERRELIGLIAIQGAEMADLIDDLLVAARAEVGMVKLEPGEMDVAAEVSGMLAAWKDGAVAMRTPAEPVVAWADPFRVRQIMRNLLTNAARYGVAPITIGMGSTGDSCWVEVTDDGPGLPRERWEMIFDPYYTAHERPGVPASVGLGLTVSRQLARLMGGDLVYRADHGTSTFRLTLPTGRPQVVTVEDTDRL